MDDVVLEIDKGIRARELTRESAVHASAVDDYQGLAGSPVLGPVSRPPTLSKDLSDEAFADTSAFSPVLVRGEAISFGPVTPNTGKEQGSQRLQSPRYSQRTSQNSPILCTNREEGKEENISVEDAAVELSAAPNAKGLQQRKDFRNMENTEKKHTIVKPPRSRMSPIREDISSVSKDPTNSDFPPKLQETGERIVSCSRGSGALQMKIQHKIPQRSLGKRSFSIYGVHEDYSADFMKQKRQRLPLDQIAAAKCEVAGTVAFFTDSPVATNAAASVRGEMPSASRGTMRRSETMPESLGTHSRNVSREVRGKQVIIR